MELGAVAFRGTARFRLVRFLGQGGMGLVYEAVDESHGAPVALKLLPFVSPDSLSRFKREFRAIADVHHPNLVRLGELVAEGAQWFFTMELVNGIDLASYVHGENVRSAPTSIGPLPLATSVTMPGGARGRRPRAAPLVYSEERLRATIAPLAGALAALHAAGCVHRDVKPTNVLVTAEGRPVLLDFGLTTTLTGESTLAGAGTPEYMAPEQILEEGVGAAADWYAFGTIIFETLTGRLPFEGPRHEIMYRKTRERPPRVGDLKRAAPADLAALCDGLLATEPAARPPAAAVLACLASGDGAAPRSRGSAAAADAGPDFGRASFVGRDQELGVLEAALREVREAAGAGALIVRGESGVGKSTLVRAFLDAQGDGALALSGRCYERELVPFKAVDGLVDALAGVLRKRDSAFVEALLPPRAAMLLHAFPVLGRVDALARAAQLSEGMDAREVRASMFAVFRELLRRLGEERPIVAVIDDLQWADADSLALLTELLRGPEAPRMLLVGTLRTQAHDVESEARLFGPEAPERHLPLRNLEGAAARALARDLLSATAPGRAGPLADLVARESAGHPLFLRELARTAHLRMSDEAPLTLDGVLRARLATFSPWAIRALRALAIAGAPTPLRALIAVVAGEGGAATVGAGGAELDELRAAKVVYATSGNVDDLVDIAHDRVRQVARASISPEEASELHERLATTFELGIDPLRAAGHWREAGHPERAAQRFADAAARAAEALAFDRAVALYETALELGAWPDERLRELEVGLADALANAGRGAASAGHYLAAARGAGPVKALELRRRGTEELIRSGRLDEGRAVAAAALADADLGFARSPLRALLGQRALLRVRGRRFRRRAVEEIAPRELARVDLCWSLSSGLGLMDPVQGAHFQVRSLLLALRAGEPYRVARGVAGEAAYAAAQGQAARARALLDEAGRIVADLDNPHATGIVSLMSGLAGHLLGRFAQGIEHLDAASRVFRERCVGTVWELNAARQFSLECLYYLGELPRFRISAAEGLREANDRGSVYATTTLRTGLANAAWLLDDEPARARHEVAEAKSGWSSRGYHIQHWYSLFAETQIALYEGDGAAAHGLVESAWPLLRRSHLLMIEHTRFVAVHLRARAALAAAAHGEGAPVAAARLRLARRCGEHLARSRGGWSRVFAGLVEGGAASLVRDDAKALAAYRRAAATARQEGLSLFAAAAELVAAEISADTAASEAALRWMSEHGAKNPRALTRMLVAGARAVG
ncbi:MAG TPA: AAA family ATPase [Polyangia bacterium]|nr:AAA family ATPase [Polyangia bacterium]